MIATNRAELGLAGHSGTPGVATGVPRRSPARPEDARSLNRSMIMSLLFAHGQLSRADLARITGLTRGSISEVSRELIETGLIRDVGPSKSDGRVGKPATLLELMTASTYVVAVDIATGHSSHEAELRGGVYNLAGDAVLVRTQSTDGVVGDALLRSTFDFIAELRAESPHTIIAVGIATPGIVDDEGTVVVSTNLQWTNMPLAKRISAEFGIPAFVVNDNNAAVLGEYMFGSHRNKDTLALTVGESIGAGLVMDGNLIRGWAFGAGEIAHVVINKDGPQCYCGRHGCLERYLNRERLLEVSKLDSHERRATLHEIGTFVGSAFAPVVAVVTPEVWAFTAGHGLLDASFLDGVRVGLEETASATSVELSFTTFDDNATTKGSIVVILQNLLGIS